jgi:hypothetical protein
MSQSQKILEHLKSGWVLTPLLALKSFGCLRLAARINDLRNEGYQIETEILREKGKSFAGYFLKTRH